MLSTTTINETNKKFEEIVKVNKLLEVFIQNQVDFETTILQFQNTVTKTQFNEFMLFWDAVINIYNTVKLSLTYVDNGYKEKIANLIIPTKDLYIEKILRHEPLTLDELQNETSHYSEAEKSTITAYISSYIDTFNYYFLLDKKEGDSKKINEKILQNMQIFFPNEEEKKLTRENLQLHFINFFNTRILPRACTALYKLIRQIQAELLAIYTLPFTYNDNADLDKIKESMRPSLKLGKKWLEFLKNYAYILDSISNGKEIEEKLYTSNITEITNLVKNLNNLLADAENHLPDEFKENRETTKKHYRKKVLLACIDIKNIPDYISEEKTPMVIHPDSLRQYINVLKNKIKAFNDNFIQKLITHPSYAVLFGDNKEIKDNFFLIQSTLLEKINKNIENKEINNQSVNLILQEVETICQSFEKAMAKIQGNLRKDMLNAYKKLKDHDNTFNSQPQFLAKKPSEKKFLFKFANGANKSDSIKNTNQNQSFEEALQEKVKFNNFSDISNDLRALIVHEEPNLPYPAAATLYESTINFIETYLPLALITASDKEKANTGMNENVVNTQENFTSQYEGFGDLLNKNGLHATVHSTDNPNGRQKREYSIDYVRPTATV